MSIGQTEKLPERPNSAGLLGQALIDAIRQAVREEIQQAISQSGINGHASPTMLTVEELSAALRVKKSWIYERTRRKKNPIPNLRTGRYPRFDLAQVKAWLKDQQG